MAKSRKLVSSISAFFPCYNDVGSIGLLVNDANDTLKKLGVEYEIIVVDDGSKDESRLLLKKLEKEIRNLKLVFHKSNKGYGGALKSGFTSSRMDYVFYTDGDGQYDAKELVKLYEKVGPGVDVVQGFKIKRFDKWYRLIIGRTYHHFAKFFFGLAVKDVDCDFRLISKKALLSIDLKFDSGVICVELVKKLQDRGYKFIEVGIHHYPRLHGHSQFFNYKRILKTLIELTFLWFNLVLFGNKWRIIRTQKF